MITYKTIKKLIEIESGMHDISIESRKRIYSDLRAIYYKMCHTFVIDFTLNGCALAVKRGHSNCLHHLNKFDFVYNDDSFKYKVIYHSVYFQLNKAYNPDLSVRPVSRMSSFQLVNIIKDKRRTITRLEKDNKELKTQLQTERAKNEEVIFEMV